MLGNFNRFERIFLIVGISLNLLSSIITRSTPISFIQAIFSIFNAVYTAKGNFFSFICSFIEAFIYIIISYRSRYYSEVLINVFINIPMSIWGLVSWLRHLDSRTKAVKVKTLTYKEVLLVVLSQIACSFFYYWLLKRFNTDLLLLSTISMAMNVLAMYFSAKRSVLVFWTYLLSCTVKLIIWTIPVLSGDFSNFPIVVSCIMYLICDAYGIITWNRLKKEQNARP